MSDTAIVGRGRNVVSCSRDGTAMLWDISQQAALASFTDVESGVINACALGDVGTSIDLGTPTETTSKSKGNFELFC